MTLHKNGAVVLRVLHAQHPLESPLEVGVAERVQHGVEAGVEVAAGGTE